MTRWEASVPSAHGRGLLAGGHFDFWHGAFRHQKPLHLFQRCRRLFNSGEVRAGSNGIEKLHQLVIIISEHGVRMQLLTERRKSYRLRFVLPFRHKPLSDAMDVVVPENRAGGESRFEALDEVQEFRG